MELRKASPRCKLLVNVRNSSIWATVKRSGFTKYPNSETIQAFGSKQSMGGGLLDQQLVSPGSSLITICYILHPSCRTAKQNILLLLHRTICRRRRTIPAKTPANFRVFFVSRGKFRCFIFTISQHDVDSLLPHELVLTPTTPDDFNADRLGRVVIFITH